MNLPESLFLYPILDSAYSADLKTDALDAIRAGVSIFQIRAKKIAKRTLFEIIEELTPVCIEKHVAMIVNDFVDVAVCTDAGVHLGQEDFPVPDARALLPDRIIGFSTHNPQQFDDALQLPVDYIAVGPIFESVTKPGGNPIVGFNLIETIRSKTTKKIVAIGGITQNDFAALKAAGVDGIAMISEIYKGPSVYEQISHLLDAASALR